MRISDWSSDVCSSDLIRALQHLYGADFTTNNGNTVYSWNPLNGQTLVDGAVAISPGGNRIFATIWDGGGVDTYDLSAYSTNLNIDLRPGQHSTFSSTGSEEQTSELQSLMRISYAVFCLKKKKKE